MEPKYIVAIVALGVFFVLFLIFFAMLARKRRMEAKLQAWLFEMYTDKNLIKFDYDSAEDEEEGEVSPENVTATQTEAVAEVKEESQIKPEEPYGKMEIEGIEEITGNYNPQK